MLKAFGTIAAALLSLLPVSISALPRAQARDLATGRVIPACGSTASGYCLAAAVAPDGQRVATLGVLPPSSLGLPPHVLTLQLWDASKLALVASREVASPPHPQGNGSPYATDPYEIFAQYAPDGSFVIVSDEDARLRVVDADDLRELRSINLRLPSGPRVYGPTDIQVSPGGDRVAVALSGLDTFLGSGFGVTTRTFKGGEVRVYSLRTGSALWEMSFKSVRIGGLTWSPDGLNLALTLQSGQGGSFRGRDIDNLLILDSASGRELLKIRTGDLAGPVCYGTHDEVFTAPFHFFYRGSKDEQVKVWNAQTGMLERKIGFPGRDVHNLLGLSLDGKLLVGYVGKEKLGFSWYAMEDVQENLDQRFAVWDVANWSLVAISPDLLGGRNSPVHLRGREGALRLQLAAHGGTVLAFWPDTPVQPVLFDLPETASNHRK